MMRALRQTLGERGLFAHIDWYLFLSALAIAILGLVTMRSFSAENAFFERQMIWIILASVAFFIMSLPEYGFLRRTPVVVGLYVLIAAVLALVYIFGSAILVIAIWFGMVLVAGLSWKHLSTLCIVGAMLGAGLWNYGLQEYQQERILTFLHPLADIQGAGYNAYQSTVAVGSGELIGKGIGYGTQSKLQFLPEYQTDFIFAAYAEEWGFVGVLLLFGLFGILIWRILAISMHGADNFVVLFAAGIAIYFVAQFIVHVGMNMGLLPITGTTLPFMSYGGSHLLTEFASLGVLVGLGRYARPRMARDETELIGAV